MSLSAQVCGSATAAANALASNALPAVVGCRRSKYRWPAQPATTPEQSAGATKG